MRLLKALLPLVLSACVSTAPQPAAVNELSRLALTSVPDEAMQYAIFQDIAWIEANSSLVYNEQALPAIEYEERKNPLLRAHCAGFIAREIDGVIVPHLILPEGINAAEAACRFHEIVHWLQWLTGNTDTATCYEIEREAYELTAAWSSQHGLPDDLNVRALNRSVESCEASKEALRIATLKEVRRLLE